MKKIRFDGGAVPNPGEMGIGIVLLENDEVIKEISEKLEGKGTNNIAEYTALSKGVSKALELGWTEVSIEGDSELIINQVNGLCMVNDRNLKVLHKKVLDKLSNFDSYTLRHIPREDNFLADELASKALEIAESPKISKSNEINDTTCPKCKMECRFKWQKFSNGTEHIRMECPHHGFVKYAPKQEPFISRAI